MTKPTIRPGDWVMHRSGRCFQVYSVIPAEAWGGPALYENVGTVKDPSTVCHAADEYIRLPVPPRAMLRVYRAERRQRKKIGKRTTLADHARHCRNISHAHQVADRAEQRARKGRK